MVRYKPGTLEYANEIKGKCGEEAFGAGWLYFERCAAAGEYIKEAKARLKG